MFSEVPCCAHLIFLVFVVFVFAFLCRNVLLKLKIPFADDDVVVVDVDGMAWITEIKSELLLENEKR